MITENLSTLKMHKLTQAQYERELKEGRIDPNAIYLTPDVNDIGSGVEIVDNLTTSDSTKALSANQGKVLNDFITKIENNTTLIKNSNGGFAAGTGAIAVDGVAIGSNAIQEEGGYDVGGVAIGSGASARMGVAIGTNATQSDIASTGGSLGLINGGAAIGKSAKALLGGAVGDKATSGNGGAVGEKATTTAGGAVGAEATSGNGGAVGKNATTDWGGAVGCDASAGYGGAVGSSASAARGGAVGYSAVAGYGFSGGNQAKCATVDDSVIDAIQLGSGTNSTERTLQVYDYQLMDANGNIPAERLANVPQIIVEDNLTSTSSANALSANQGKVLYNAISTETSSRQAADTTLQENIDALPIKDVTGQTMYKGSYSSSGTATAGTGATIIGDLRTVQRTTSSDGIRGNSATGKYATAIGMGVSASGESSVALCEKSQSSGHASLTAGYLCKATDDYSVAMGYMSTASYYGFAFGGNVKAGISNFTIGHYNKTSDTTGSMSGTEGNAFIIGNGTSSATSNAFRVTYGGGVYGKGSFKTSGADYAEYFEWIDGNPDNEDRRGRFVTVDGEKIRFATADDDYILGVVSAAPAVEGDNYDDDWQGKYLTDIFGARLTQTVHHEAVYEERETIDPETGEKTIEKVLLHEAYDSEEWILNPDYDPTQEYISREHRKEWSPVGFMGKLVVVDDGTCEVNKYCCASKNGIATKTTDKSGYRVMERIDDTHIKILVR